VSCAMTYSSKLEAQKNELEVKFKDKNTNTLSDDCYNWLL